MRLRRATQSYDVLTKTINNSYTFKKRRVLSTLDVFKPKKGKEHARVMSLNFNSRDLGANSLKGGGTVVEQVSSLGLLSLMKVKNQVGLTLTLG